MRSLSPFWSAVSLSALAHLAAAVWLPSLRIAEAARPPAPAVVLDEIAIAIEPEAPAVAPQSLPEPEPVAPAVVQPASAARVAPPSATEQAGGPAAAPEVIALPADAATESDDVYPADAHPLPVLRSGWVANGGTGDGSSAAPAAPPAVVPKSGADDSADLARKRREASARYAALLHQRILRMRHYPAALQELGLEGTVNVRFQVNSSGGVSALAASGGAPAALERAAVQAVRDAAPFPALPPELSSFTAVVPIAFVLRR